MKDPNTFEDAMLQLAHKLAAVVISKQHDYGKDNIINNILPAEDVCLLRLNEKLIRLKNLLGKGSEAKNESVEDTVMDIMGYAAVLYMVLEDTFELPLENRG